MDTSTNDKQLKKGVNIMSDTKKYYMNQITCDVATLDGWANQNDPSSHLSDDSTLYVAEGQVPSRDFLQVVRHRKGGWVAA
jgi:hypothetical protein